MPPGSLWSRHPRAQVPPMHCPDKPPDLSALKQTQHPGSLFPTVAKGPVPGVAWQIDRRVEPFRMRDSPWPSRNYMDGCHSDY